MWKTNLKKRVQLKIACCLSEKQTLNLFVYYKPTGFKLKLCNNAFCNNKKYNRRMKYFVNLYFTCSADN